MDGLRRRAIVAALAIGIDQTLGDPPNRYHPVAWMGQAIGWIQGMAPKEGAAAQFAYGAGLVAGGLSAMSACGRMLSGVCHGLPGAVGLLAEAAALKSMVALRGLVSAGEQIEARLHDNDLPEARRLLSWHLVSRDTSELSASQVSAATIESLAENLSDGAIAPLVYYALAGLPGALAYRFANTCDAMLGYRDAAREWLGKAPARWDDLLNLLPARLSAALIVAAARFHHLDADRAADVWARDAGATASPNAGHPMSAMAGALGVELEKVDHYCLGAGGRPPEADDIAGATRLIRAATALGVSAFLIVGLLASRRRASRRSAR